MSTSEPLPLLEHPNHPHPDHKLLKPESSEGDPKSLNPELNLDVKIRIDPDVPIIQGTMALMPDAVKREVTKGIVKLWAEEKKTQESNLKTAHHQDDFLRGEKCVISVIRKGATSIPPNRVFSILTNDRETKDPDPVAICFDLQDLIEADKNKKVLPKTHPSYDLIPNIARSVDFAIAPEAVVRYGLDSFDYFPAALTKKIREHQKHYLELQSVQDLVEMDTIYGYIQNAIAPILHYLLQKVEGLFDAIFGTSIFATFSKAYIKGIGSVVGQAASYVAGSAQSALNVLKRNSPMIKWIVDKIWSSTKFLIKFVYRNPLLTNLAIWCTYVFKIIWCVWYQGPKVGIETLASWAERQWAFNTGSTIWKSIVNFARTLATCLTGNIFDCLWQSMTFFFHNTWGWSYVFIDTVFTYSGIKFLGRGIGTAVTSLFGKQTTALREEAMGLLSLDWAMFVQTAPIILPKLLEIAMLFFNIPPSLIVPAQNGLRWVSSLSSYWKFFSYFVPLLWDILITLWYCARGSGECCYPSQLKERYSLALDNESKGIEPTSYERLSNYGSYLKGQVSYFFSDERIKFHVMTTDVTVDGISIHLYTLRSDFLAQLGLENSKKLPKWIRKLQENRAFWEKQVFFGVSAQEVEKLYPEAVQSYCFSKSTKTKKLPQCTKYILFCKLPEQLRRTLAQMNQDYYERPKVPQDATQVKNRRRPLVIGTQNQKVTVKTRSRSRKKKN